jgi:hypothetical protein
MNKIIDVIKAILLISVFSFSFFSTIHIIDTTINTKPDLSGNKIESKILQANDFAENFDNFNYISQWGSWNDSGTESEWGQVTESENSLIKFNKDENSLFNSGQNPTFLSDYNANLNCNVTANPFEDISLSNNYCTPPFNNTATTYDFNTVNSESSLTLEEKKFLTDYDNDWNGDINLESFGSTSGQDSNLYYPFDDNLEDLSGNNRDGSGSAVYTTGIKNSAITGNGAGSEVTTPEFNMSSATNGFTISTWVYYTGGTGNYPIFHSNTSGDEIRMYVGYSTVARIYFYIGGTNVGDFTFPTNEWVHLFYTVEYTGGNAYLNAWWNSTKKQTDTNFGSKSYPSGDTQKLIGRDITGGWYYGSNTRIDDFIIFDEVLTNEDRIQIALAYNPNAKSENNDNQVVFSSFDVDQELMLEGVQLSGNVYDNSSLYITGSSDNQEVNASSYYTKGDNATQTNEESYLSWNESIAQFFTVPSGETWNISHVGYPFLSFDLADWEYFEDEWNDSDIMDFNEDLEGWVNESDSNIFWSPSGWAEIVAPAGTYTSSMRVDDLNIDTDIYGTFNVSFKPNTALTEFRLINPDTSVVCLDTTGFPEDVWANVTCDNLQGDFDWYSVDTVTSLRMQFTSSFWAVSTLVNYTELFASSPATYINGTIGISGVLSGEPNFSDVEDSVDFENTTSTYPTFNSQSYAFSSSLLLTAGTYAIFLNFTLSDSIYPRIYFKYDNATSGGNITKDFFYDTSWTVQTDTDYFPFFNFSLSMTYPDFDNIVSEILLVTSLTSGGSAVLQNFTRPVYLATGTYFLVLNDTSAIYDSTMFSVAIDSDSRTGNQESVGAVTWNDELVYYRYDMIFNLSVYELTLGTVIPIDTSTGNITIFGSFNVTTNSVAEIGDFGVWFSNNHTSSQVQAYIVGSTVGLQPNLTDIQSELVSLDNGSLIGYSNFTFSSNPQLPNGTYFLALNVTTDKAYTFVVNDLLGSPTGDSLNELISGIDNNGFFNLSNFDVPFFLNISYNILSYNWVTDPIVYENLTEINNIFGYMNTSLLVEGLGNYSFYSYNDCITVGCTELDQTTDNNPPQLWDNPSGYFPASNDYWYNDELNTTTLNNAQGFFHNLTDINSDNNVIDVWFSHTLGFGATPTGLYSRPRWGISIFNETNYGDTAFSYTDFSSDTYSSSSQIYPQWNTGSDTFPGIHFSLLSANSSVDPLGQIDVYEEYYDGSLNSNNLFSDQSSTYGVGETLDPDFFESIWLRFIFNETSSLWNITVNWNRGSCQSDTPDLCSWTEIANVSTGVSFPNNEFDPDYVLLWNAKLDQENWETPTLLTYHMGVRSMIQTNKSIGYRRLFPGFNFTDLQVARDIPGVSEISIASAFLQADFYDGAYPFGVNDTIEIFLYSLDPLDYANSSMLSWTQDDLGTYWNTTSQPIDTTNWLLSFNLSEIGNDMSLNITDLLLLWEIANPTDTLIGIGMQMGNFSHNETNPELMRFATMGNIRMNLTWTGIGFDSSYSYVFAQIEPQDAIVMTMDFWYTTQATASWSIGGGNGNEFAFRIASGIALQNILVNELDNYFDLVLYDGTGQVFIRYNVGNTVYTGNTSIVLDPGEKYKFIVNWQKDEGQISVGVEDSATDSLLSGSYTEFISNFSSSKIPTILGETLNTNNTQGLKIVFNASSNLIFTGESQFWVDSFYSTSPLLDTGLTCFGTGTDDNCENHLGADIISDFGPGGIVIDGNSSDSRSSSTWDYWVHDFRSFSGLASITWPDLVSSGEESHIFIEIKPYDTSGSGLDTMDLQFQADESGQTNFGVSIEDNSTFSTGWQNSPTETIKGEVGFGVFWERPGLLTLAVKYWNITTQKLQTHKVFGNYNASDLSSSVRINIDYRVYTDRDVSGTITISDMVFTRGRSLGFQEPAIPIPDEIWYPPPPPDFLTWLVNGVSRGAGNMLGWIGSLGGIFDDIWQGILDIGNLIFQAIIDIFTDFIIPFIQDLIFGFIDFFIDDVFNIRNEFNTLIAMLVFLFAMTFYLYLLLLFSIFGYPLIAARDMDHAVQSIKGAIFFDLSFGVITWPIHIPIWSGLLMLVLTLSLGYENIVFPVLPF